MGDRYTELTELRAKLIQTIAIINKLRHMGRPPGSNVVLEAEALLILSLQNGLNRTQACLQAGISRPAFYIELERNETFLDKIDKAEQFGSMKARQNIMKSIDSGDLNTSKWYLERKDPEFKPKSDLTSDDMPLKTALVEFVGDDGKPDPENQD